VSGPLRSSAWFGAPGKTGIMHRSWLRAEGLPDDAFDGRPVVGIANSWSELSPCNVHLRGLAEHVKRGVWQAGGVPLEFPATSTGEALVRPAAMLLRNLMSMDVEETIRANPIDAVVLLTGCDKTTPAYLMGAISADLPTIVLTGGPMLNGKFRGADIGSGTSVWRYTEAHRAGTMSEAELHEAEAGMARSHGHCMTMGTASTMACLAEILGLALPGSAALPADDARRRTLAHIVGRRAVAIAEEGLRPRAILDRRSFLNAVRANAALGGSTNAVIHLLALAGRAGVDLDLDDFDEAVRDVPTLVDVVPVGRHLMEEFAYAGGVGALVSAMGDLLDRDARTVNGTTLGEAYAEARPIGEDVVHPRERPLRPPGSGIAVLRGNLAPDGAVIKQSAASPQLLVHRGRAVVWDDLRAYLRDADDPECDLVPDDVLIVRNAGPRGYPGMPEIANLPLPRVLLAAGVQDMVRISDARMSGTSYGTVILHVAPESAVGGPLALVRTGDIVALDVPGRSLAIEVSDEELARRAREWVAPELSHGRRGYLRLYLDHVQQASVGADFDFLVGAAEASVPRQAF
jgi:dihydroxy-acid dehydratase